MSGDTEQNVRNCACGGEPQFMELCEAFSFGRAEAISLNGGKPVCFRIACPRCGFTTADHKTVEGAIDEWNIHASENSPKTLADISKGLRDWADKLPEEEACSWFERPVEQMQEILRDIADKIDAAWKLQMSQSWHHREMEELILRHENEVAELKKRIPKPDPDWKAICEKCQDGDIEPDCEYYGEPNGCNSPIYGEHPKAQPVFNVAAMIHALKVIEGYAQSAECHTEDSHVLGYLNQIRVWVRNALSAPSRNCDRPECKDTKSAQFVWEREDGGNTAYYEWLLSPAHEKGTDDGE